MPLSALLDFRAARLRVGAEVIADRHQIGRKLAQYLLVDAPPLRPEVPEAASQWLIVLE